MLLLKGVPQGSVLGPLLFNIYINDLFYLVDQTDISNYADDTTFYACDIDLKNLVQRLEHDSSLAIEWFESNYMKLNPEKCHFIISGHKHEVVFANIDQNIIWESSNQKLLGVILDKDLKFDKHISFICKKAGRKLNALARITRFLSQEKRRVLMKSFVESQFNYCPLIWMFCGKEMNNKINKIHEKALRSVYNDYTSSFEDLLNRDNSITIHHRNIKLLATEIFKVKNNITTDTFSELFVRRNIGYNLRSQPEFSLDSVNTTYYGLNSIKYLGPRLWNLLPNDVKNSENLTIFQQNIKSWKPINCPCKICN